MWGTVAITVIVVSGIALAIWLWWRSRIFDTASDMAKQVFPVWAAQGPFDSGAESAAAMRNAYLAVLGADQTEEMADGIEGHATAYDADPETWEKTRRTALEVASSDALTLAEGIAAAEGLNKSLIEDGGHRLEFTRLPDGSTVPVYKQIWSDEEIEKQKKENDEAIVSGIGQGLLNDSGSSEEARELVEFLSDLYRAEMDEEPDASALGRIWFGLVTTGIDKDEPEPELDPEILQTFKRLKEAHQLATKPSYLKWSENPGCFEAHLKRKHDNPLFPEQDREVTQEQIDEAKKRDQEDALELQDKLLELLSDIKEIPAAGTMDDFSVLMERINDLLDEAAGIGGDTEATAESLNEIYTSLVVSIRESHKDNDEALEAIDKADAFHQERVKTISTPFTLQVLRINERDFIPAMLSETPETIQKAMSLIGEDTKPFIVKEACELLKGALAKGADMSLIDEKLKAITGEDG